MNRKERRRQEKSRRKTGAAKADVVPVFERAYGQQRSGNFDAAIAGYEQVLALDPGHAASHCNLGSVLMQSGQVFQAMQSFRKAVRLEPANKLYWAGLAQSLRPILFTSVDQDLLDDLSGVLEQSNVSPRTVIRPILSALNQHPEFSRVMAAVAADGGADGGDYADLAAALSGIPLFLSLLKSCPINDPALEDILTRLRRSMMAAAVSDRISPDTLPFAAALALQCFLTEYIFDETPDERDGADRLRRELARHLDSGNDLPPGKIAAFAAYRPLHGLAGAGALRAPEGADAIAEVIAVQVKEFLDEQALRARIEPLSAIDDPVSKAVREQYEDNPYPRWTRTALSDKPRALGDILRTNLVPLEPSDPPLPEGRNILIAGCGTGRQCVQAATLFPRSDILAMDLSLSSLAYAMRKSLEAGVSNIEYRHGDILELGTLADRRFDYVICTGVLHHMGDPMAGWRALRGVLEPGGLMRIGLYSERARRAVVRLRDFIAERGLTPALGDIRRCRKEILAMADTDPGIAAITQSPNFASFSECRDLLFHVQEHCFDIPGIAAALRDLDLEFLGFELQDPGVLRAFHAFTPDGPDPRSLAQWHRFEAEHPDTFAGMYLLWARRPA